MLQGFGKALGVGGTAKRPPGALPLSVIGADVRIVGDIITQGEMQIDGQVDGDITCQRLVVGEGARIAGEVSAETVEVHGELRGKINAGSVVIARTARVYGDVTHESLEIEAGAQMEGHLLRKASGAAPQHLLEGPSTDPTKAEIKKGNGAHPPAEAQSAAPADATAAKAG
jgi:cytoskeletal protein CcmA (bactofilin family)